MPTYNGRDRKDVLIRQIREAIAEENRKDIIERLWKGRQERVRRGLPPGGTAPYGYRRDSRGLVTHPAEAEAVRMIFELMGCGHSSSVIARALSQMGLRRRNGTAWTPRQVAAVLSRRAHYEEGLVRYGAAVGENKGLVLLEGEASKRVPGVTPGFDPGRRETDAG